MLLCINHLPLILQTQRNVWYII